MQGVKRKLVYVGAYEVLGLLLGTSVMTLLTGNSLSSTGPLAIMVSVVCTSWNMGYNYLFEAWESRQRDRTRTVWRRILHAVVFQVTLVCFLVPLIAWWLGISLVHAFLLDIVFIVYVPFYTLAYNWAFDKIFGVPTSAMNDADPQENVMKGKPVSSSHLNRGETETDADKVSLTIG
ncbi:PACE efflux transporter [Spirillospora sp. NPDC052269]